MDISTRNSRLRGMGKAVLAAVLVLLLFVSGLAAGDSSLHQWLHSDQGSPSHFCLVSMLDHGQTHSAATHVFLVVPSDDRVIERTPCEFTFISVDSPLFSGRGPPCLT